MLESINYADCVAQVLNRTTRIGTDQDGKFEVVVHSKPLADIRRKSIDVDKVRRLVGYDRSTMTGFLASLLRWRMYY
ncbi:MAG: hypothetical protein QW756_00140 [Nitrososphaerota archaeon]